MSKGGTTRALRGITVFLTLLTFCILWVAYKQKKERYTELWDKVNNHGMRIEALENE